MKPVTKAILYTFIFFGAVESSDAKEWRGLVPLRSRVVQVLRNPRAEASVEEYAVYSAVIANMFAGERGTFDTQAKIKILVIQDQTSTDPTADFTLNNDGPYFRRTFPTLTERIVKDYIARNDFKFDKDGQYFRRMFPTLMEGVVKDYIARNKAPVRLRDSFFLMVKHVLVEKQEIEKIFNGGGWWEEFYKKYPDSGGFIILSRVGFNAAKNQALVYIQHGCGGLCGTGHYVLLEKSVDGWKVIKRSMVWIS